MNSETRDVLVQASKPVRWAAAAALIMLALFLFVKTGDAVARYGEGDQPQINTITVTGEGKSTATPDIAHISFTVQESAATVSAAQDAATKKANDALAAVKDLGIADKDVQTSGYSINPQYAQSAPCYAGVGVMCPRTTSNTITGYEVRESVTLTVRDTAKAGDVLTALGKLGVQNVSGPDFAVDDNAGITDDARAAAIANARAKAKELAKELGVSLGDVVSYSDNGNQMPYAYGVANKAMDAVAPTPNLAVGTEERTVTVQITYRIR